MDTVLHRHHSHYILRDSGAMRGVVLFTDVLRTLAIAGAAILIAVSLAGARTSYRYRSSGPPWVYRWLFLASYIILIVEVMYFKIEHLGRPPSMLTLLTIAAVVSGIVSVTLIGRHSKGEWAGDVERRRGHDRRRRKS